MQIQHGKDCRRTARIPVDAVLLYRAGEAREFKLCHVLNVSTLSMEMLLDQPLPRGTVVTTVVFSEGSSKHHYYVVGQVLRVQQCSWQQRLFHEGEGGWVHVIAAAAERPWSPMFIYDVICSTYYPAPKKPAEKSATAYRSGQHADGGERQADLHISRASTQANPLVGTEKRQRADQPGESVNQ